MTLPFDSQQAAAPTTLEGVLERIVFSNEENAWSVVRAHRAGPARPGDGGGQPPGRAAGGEPAPDRRLDQRPEVRQAVPRRLLCHGGAGDACTGIEKYLGSGLIRGIGKVMASRLVATFGLETLDVIEHRPERLTEVEGIGPKRSREILRAWAEQREIKEVMIFLQSHGVSTHYAIKIYKAYGPQATELVRENPYRLATDIHGIGFKSADKIAAALGIPPTAPQRIEAGSLYLLGQGGGPRPRLSAPQDADRGGGEAPRGAGRPGRAGASRALAETEQVVVETARRSAEEQAVFLKALHAAEIGRGGARARAPHPAAAAAGDRRRPRPRLVREARADRARPPAAAGDPRRPHAQGAGDHRRPGHRQDDAGARHRQDPGEEAPAGAARRPHRPRRQAPGRGHRARRPRPSTGCWSSTPRPGSSTATASTRSPATC